MDAFVGPRVRRVVADVLGVDAALCTPEVSLTDDLAADSLDVTELCIALEDEFAIALPHGLPRWVRTCGQLVTFVNEMRPVPAPMLVVTVTPMGEASPPFVKSAAFTPYDVEGIVEDALTFAPGTQVDVAVENADGPTLVALRDRFHLLRRRGVSVQVHRLGELGKHPNAA